MPLTQTPGIVTLDGTEQNLFASQTTLQHYATWVFTNLMAAGDTIVLRVFVKDEQGAVERKYDEITVTGAQDPPAIFFPFVPTDSYRVTVERTAGTVASINWAREETA